MTRIRIAVACAIAGLVVLFFAADLDAVLTLERLRELQLQIAAFRAQQPLQAALLYMLLYVVLTGLSLPVAAVMTMAAGAIFGLFWGTVLACIAATTGAALAFLAARFLLRDAVERRFPRPLAAVNRGMERDGALYLFMLRVVPLFPFLVVNIVMALTRIRFVTFFFVSLVGMVAGTLLFVNAGAQLAGITSPADVLSPPVLLSLALLGVFPLAARLVIEAVRRRRAAAGSDG